jgi:transcriptional/translational regulatory protein YebC/TACO1
LFRHEAVIVYPLEVAPEEVMLEVALESGALDCEVTDDGYTIVGDPSAWHELRDALVARFGDPLESSLRWEPLQASPSSEAVAESFGKLLHALDDLDDVQSVYHNAL